MSDDNFNFCKRFGATSDVTLGQFCSMNAIEKQYIWKSDPASYSKLKQQYDDTYGQKGTVDQSVINSNPRRK